MHYNIELERQCYLTKIHSTLVTDAADHLFQDGCCERPGVLILHHLPLSLPSTRYIIYRHNCYDTSHRIDYNIHNRLTRPVAREGRTTFSYMCIFSFPFNLTITACHRSSLHNTPPALYRPRVEITAAPLNPNV